MKNPPKTSSKTLGRLMIKGGAVPARQTSINQNGESGVVASETTANNIKKRVGEELNQLDIDSFESVLQDAASSKRIFPKNDSSSPEHESSSNQVDFNIMSLIENTKRQAASNGTSTKDSVKFDDVDEFIDEGADDVVIGKPPNKPIHLMNVTSPIRGNPVTDYDRLPETNGVSNIGVHDPFSRMEMGHQTLPQDILNAERIRNSQKNVRCDENEQLNYIHEKGLNEYSKFDTILGPASHGEFASFSQNLTPVISCELGALNPVSMNAMQHFQTLTPNGRLLPAIPRKYFSSNENHQRITTRPAPQKSPVTIMLQTTAPSFHNTTSADSNMANVHSGTPISSVIPSAVVEAQLSPESASSKKKAKKAAAKKAKAAKEAADAENVVIEGEERNDINENDDKKDTEEAAIGETVTDQNKASGQTKSKAQKAKDKKKAKKEQDEMKDIGRDEEKNDSSLVNAPEEPPKNQLDNGRKTAGGKNKKNGKNVSSEYTVEANGVGSHSLVEILKELGLEVSDLVESKKKNKKGNNGGKKNKQQEKKQASPKETARSPPSDNETIPTDDGADKIKKPVQPTKKKMDEVAVAASITKRCSSGVGQSEEDDDQSYVSAQENLGGSTSRLSTPPLQAEFVDARQSRDDIIDNVMLDPNNYRDDEDVESLAKQLQQQEDEFITVGKNKKKNKKQSSIPENVSASSTASSSSPPNRRNTHPDARVNTTPSVSSSNNQQHHQRGNNRTAAHPTTLGDFMESTKKDTHKNIKHKKVMSPISTISQKKQMSIEDPTPSSPAFVDALETPISVNTTSTFSYADAAKKSSGENTPAQEMSPVPTSGSTNTATINQSSPAAHQNSQDLKQKASESSYAASKGISTAVSSAVQLPASSAAVADSDISFGYEETPEDKQLRREQKESSVVIEQNVPIKPLDFMNQFRDMKVSVMPAEGKSENNIIDDQIMKVWKARWDDFQTKGAKPIMYNPSQKK
ncbi:hypothetical protein L5515_003856 [Caenorhabditis briggsae]|uniref:Protein CBR-SPAT-2 n=2 Tax=Caenorhabditis briggsae TaxID=6238 RepID=A0AAE9EJQ1_CAEBR|nr:hypothetical protein L5515_003856 [Caenorhabditis briggsae]